MILETYKARCIKSFYEDFSGLDYTIDMIYEINIHDDSENEDSVFYVNGNEEHMYLRDWSEKSNNFEILETTIHIIDSDLLNLLFK